MYFLLAAKIDFNRIARERGIEVLLASELPPETAEWLVDEVMKLLKKVVGDQLN